VAHDPSLRKKEKEKRRKKIKRKKKRTAKPAWSSDTEYAVYSTGGASFTVRIGDSAGRASFESSLPIGVKKNSAIASRESQLILYFFFN
jgi:hypothetical protein